jgi:hypothetical protein
MQHRRRAQTPRAVQATQGEAGHQRSSARIAVSSRPLTAASSPTAVPRTLAARHIWPPVGVEGRRELLLFAEPRCLLSAAARRRRSRGTSPPERQAQGGAAASSCSAARCCRAAGSHRASRVAGEAVQRTRCGRRCCSFTSTIPVSLASQSSIIHAQRSMSRRLTFRSTERVARPRLRGRGGRGAARVGREERQ